MIVSLLLLAVSLAVILFAAECFTNAVESLGNKFKLSQAVVGSLLAAVGTALPETILPIVAIFFVGHGAAKEIGVGAILGAPFMLSTIGFFLIGATATVSYLRKRRPFEVSVETRSTRRDLSFFLSMYSLAVFVPLLTGGRANALLAFILFGGYVYYVYRTIRGESGAVAHIEDLYTCRLCRMVGILDDESTPLVLIIFQILATLGIMVFGAHLFVGSLERLAFLWGLSPLLFALILAPIATELPEKFNSITWTLKGKDSLAMGNMSGAMVFQSTFPVSVGLLFTPWHVTGLALVSALVALASGTIMLVVLTRKNRLSPFALLFGGLLYVAYLTTLIVSMSR